MVCWLIFIKAKTINCLACDYSTNDKTTMRLLEIRRHSLRNRAYPDLSSEGIALAQRIGLGMGKFNRVVASPLPRAIQTAQAMGFKVDETVELLATTTDPVEMECPWPASFAEYAAAYKQGGPTFRFARRLAEFYGQLMQSTPEGGAALTVHHGGVVEISAIACLPNADFASLGAYCSYCEGARLIWDDGKFVSVEVLRV